MHDALIDCVVKVGGSLYDLPDLADRLHHFLRAIADRPYLLVPGGGQIVQAIRAFDACHHLGEETSHWLALRALSLNAHFLAGTLSSGRVVPDAEAAHRAWRAGAVPVRDGHAFAVADEDCSDHLPHRWAATSDALAARVATVMQARELVLLKSVTLPDPLDLAHAAHEDHIDKYVSQMLGKPIRVWSVNLRRQERA